MNRTELKNTLIEMNYPKYISIRNNEDLLNDIKRNTSFLDSIAKVDYNFRMYCIIYDILEIPVCLKDGCDNKVSIRVSEQHEKDSTIKYNNKRFKKYCSNECMRSDPNIKLQREKTIEDRYGTKNIFASEYFSNNRKRFYLESFGAESPLGSDDINEKKKKTLLERYGVENSLQSELVKQKVVQTNLERYGTSNPLQNDKVKEKAQITNQERYGVNWNTQREELKQANRDKMQELYGVDNVTFKHIPQETMYYYYNPKSLEELYNEYFFYVEDLASYLGLANSTTYKWLSENNIPVKYNHSSKLESDVASFIELLGFICRRGDRSIINPYELDIVIPEKKVAIEFNGIYWHSELYKERSYHQKKSNIAHSMGYELIHIWEDQWLDETKQKIIKNKIRSKLGLSERVYARKTTIRNVTGKNVRTFYDNNHIQGFVGASIHYGLYDDDELVACVSFQDHGNGKWELVRYATSKSVVGGFSKLLKYFKSNHEWDMIYTFAHLDYSKGELYDKNGFNMKHITQPGMWYIKGCERYSRQKFMKHKLKDKLETFDPNLTEVQNMHNNEYLRLFDAGSIRYEMYNE